MNRFLNRKSILFIMIALTLVAGFAGALLLHTSATHAASTKAATSSNKVIGQGNNHPLCSRLGKNLQASQGAQMFCFGPQTSGGSHTISQTRQFGSNVDAANPTEDRSAAGVQAYGQSETSIAAAGSYVVEAWNDSTGFFATCGSTTNNKEELTGFGFSNNGGRSFTDLGGLPNTNCATSRIEGDPSVEVYTVGGHTYFYISSIFIPFSQPENALSVTACEVIGSGSSATLSCGQPIIAAISSDCANFGFLVCSFLDKEFLSIDPVRGRLYMSYTEFGVSTPANSNGIIELASCDLSTPATPTCYNGNAGVQNPPYLVLANGDANCEQEGAYPAVDKATGDVYVAWEFNWATNFFSFACASVPTRNIVAHVPFSCLTIPVASCSGPSNTASVNVISMDAAFIPGYNRFPANDFPRIAVSDAHGTVSIVWNDANLHPLGDIMLQSFWLGSLAPVQSSPVRLNSDTGGLHFLPALRYSNSRGGLDVSWYSRKTGNTTLTNVSAVLNVNPTSTSTPSHTTVTTTPTDWNAVSSDIVPNFGDYTDNYVVGNVDYVAWSDGRIGEPQPYMSHQID